MILIVDDSPTDIELTGLALEATGRGISVLSAPDGQSALAMLRTRHALPALILLDMKMPCMGGIEVLREIRADNRLRAPCCDGHVFITRIGQGRRNCYRCQRLFSEAFVFGSVQQRFRVYPASLAAELALDTLLKVSVST